MRTTLAFILAFGLSVFALLAGHVAAQETKPPPVFRIFVHDKSQICGPGSPLPNLFMASSTNEWNPGATAAGGRFSEPGSTRGWIFEISAATARNPDFAFKFTRGSWNTVEVDDQGRDISNRRIDPTTLTPDVAELHIALEGFADQRGKRFPEQAASPPPTITGDVDVFTMASKTLGTERTIRVWKPPIYAQDSANGVRFPVMYFQDGQNMFSRADNPSGVEWQADETGTRLISREHRIPAILMVGIDGSGPNRAVDYNPPGTTVKDKASAGDKYLAFVVDELMPEIERRYSVKTGPEYTGLGGSSFGANATLYAAMERPDVFGRILIESPALWIGDGALVTRAKACKKWPLRVWIAMSDTELGDSAKDAALAAQARDLETAIHSKGVGPDRCILAVDPGSKHDEEAWAKRLPDALIFLWNPGG